MSNTYKSVTMKEIAKQAGLSITTVSKVINKHPDISQATKDKVSKTIDELGYVQNMMAANLRKNKANLVGLILSDISKPYFSKVISGYERVFGESGYQTLIFSSNEDAERERNLIRQVLSINIAGIIIDLAQNGNKNVDLLEVSGVPYVFSNRFTDVDKGYYVAADNKKAGLIATQYLLKSKPNAPVLSINGPDNISPTVMRFEGYCQALKQAKISRNDNWVFNNHYDLTDAHRTGAYIAKNFKPPYSVFCSTDQIAIGLLRALKENNIKIQIITYFSFLFVCVPSMAHV